MNTKRACDIFPLIDGDEFEALKRNIAEHGQREPIIYVDGEIIDGRNRLRACNELGIEPVIRNLSADEAGDVFALVMSLNFHRRHLRPHEKGAALAAYMEHVGAKKGAGRPKKNSADSAEFPKTLPQVAEKLGIPERTARDHIQAAEDYIAAAPEARAKVDAGEITPKQARIETERKERRDDSEKPSRARRKRSALDALFDCVEGIEKVISKALKETPEIQKPLCAELRSIERRLNPTTPKVSIAPTAEWNEEWHKRNPTPSDIDRVKPQPVVRDDGEFQGAKP